MDYRRLKVREIAEGVGMSSEWVYHILTLELGMKKIFTRCVLRLLTFDHKCSTVEMSHQSFTCFQHNQQDFVRRFVTKD